MLASAKQRRTRAALRNIVEMGRGSRHSKNAGTMGSEAQTYSERAGQGYGTISQRLGKVRDPRSQATSVRTPARTRCNPPRAARRTPSATTTTAEFPCSPWRCGP